MSYVGYEDDRAAWQNYFDDGYESDVDWMRWTPFPREKFTARFGPLFRQLERERLARAETFRQMRMERNEI